MLNWIWYLGLCTVHTLSCSKDIIMSANYMILAWFYKWMVWNISLVFLFVCFSSFTCFNVLFNFLCRFSSSTEQSTASRLLKRHRRRRKQRPPRLERVKQHQLLKSSLCTVLWNINSVFFFFLFLFFYWQTFSEVLSCICQYINIITRKCMHSVT